MKDSLRPGLSRTFRYRVPETKTVPRIYPEAPDFQMMPPVLATGYFVALCEWACIELIKPHLDWPREMTLGTHVDLSHAAATPPGLRGTYRYRVPESKTVPRIYPEAPDFQVMPAVLATGYLVALAEWACIELIKPHLDWPREQSLGTHVNLSHLAATPPGLEVEISVSVTAVEGRKLTFAVSAHDGVDRISEGTLERHTIDAERFERKVAAKVPAA